MKNISPIIKTLVYADIFDYPLTETEMWRFLLETKITWQTFRHELTRLEGQSSITSINGFYTLKGREQLVKLRRKREKISRYKLLKAQKAALLLQLVPMIYFVGISGSLARNNTEKEHDIDFFIISAPHTLWLTRLFTVAILSFLGWRRKRDEYVVKDKICLNMFLDAHQLRLPRSEQNLYTAHEIALVRPLLNRYKTYERFLWANRWIKKYLPHVRLERFKVAITTYQPSWLLKQLEGLVRKAQLFYMKKPIFKEKISLYLLQFHPYTMRDWVIESYEKRLARWSHPKGGA